ncbi:MAG: lysophospholipid acyltransferase family protein, partial [Nannocystaceae bacterium]
REAGAWRLTLPTRPARGLPLVLLPLGLLRGAGARAAQVVFVDKDSTGSKVRALRAVRQRLRAGRTVSVFPEGSTFEGDEVRPFFRGSLAAARGIDAEVIPVGLAYPPGIEYLEESFLEHMRRYAARAQVRVGMVVGDPITLDGLGASPEEHLRARVQELVEEARDLVGRAS